MSRRALVLTLALLETATLLAGTAAALSPPVAPATTVAVAPVAEPVLHANAVARTTQAQPVRKAAPRAPRPVARPRHQAHHVRVRRTRHVAAHHPRLSYEQRLMRAVDRIPGYHPGDAVWSITPSFGHWGVADIYGGVVYISPTVPDDRLYDVVAHEWSHLLSVKPYDGDVTGALDAMNTYFGGSGLEGAERAADCMARLLGASWTHYTPCSDAHWRAGARRLLAHERL